MFEAQKECVAVWRLRLFSFGVGLLDFLNGFLGWLVRLSFFVSLFRPPFAYSLSRLRKVNALAPAYEQLSAEQKRGRVTREISPLLPKLF